MRNRHMITLAAALAVSAALGIPTAAAIPQSDVTDAYDRAVGIQNEMDCLDVTVRESTVVPGVKDNAQENISIKASGLQNLQNLKAAITIKADEGEKNQYYADGYFYDNQSGKNMKYAMKPEEMLEIMNYYVYLDLNSTRLSMLEQDGDEFAFNATQDTLGDYTDKVLEGAQEENHIQIVALQGTASTDGTNITKRSIQTVYTIKSGDGPQTCTVNTRETFHNPGQAVTVELPDLSAYHEKSENKAVVNITDKRQTVYATEDLNVRAQNSVTSTILGGIAMGDEIQQTGYTSDGWTQIQYGDVLAYVSSEFVSTEKPITTSDLSGTMYAAVSVNVRDKAGTAGAILGILEAGEAVRVTGYTNNNWIRVNYNGKTGYVSDSYLTWDQPVTAMGGTMYVSAALANVRTYYSTDSAVITTLNQGTAVEVTGYTPNNWIRVNYQGNTGYIYGDLLSWNAPYQYSYGYVEGVVAETSMNSLTIWGNDGMTYTFNSSNADKSAARGMSNGDSVSVYYTDQNGTLAATEIIVNSAAYAQSGDEEGLVYGTVMSFGMSTLTLACDDGETRTFDKGDAYIDCPGGLYVGLYVAAAYYYDNQRGYVLDYMSEG